MQPALIVLNAGSSSLKFSLFLIENTPALKRIFYGQVEALDEQPKFLVKDNENKKLIEQSLSIEKNKNFDPQSYALEIILTWLKQNNSHYKICAAGHRIVHGGHVFTIPVSITPSVLTQLETFIPLAPLHQPYNIAGIKTLSQQIPALFQVACFDTAFHATQPDIAQTYALPEGISPIPIKHYGFHGLSYEYIAQVMPNYLGSEKAKGKTIVAHLGHGASLCAMLNQKSIATTMGFTALDGLPMGTRCGNLDPGIILYLSQIGMSTGAITELLYKQSGLLGVSKVSSDVRSLLASHDCSAKKAIDLFVYRIQRELGSLIAALNGLDNLIFTAGIGEHSAEIRSRVCTPLTELQFLLDNQANQKNNLKISPDNSKIDVWAIPTNEELIIAQHTLHLLRSAPK